MIDYAVLALLLGIKHSFDADHLLAVSNLLARVRSLKQAALMGLSWAAGHMVTATALTAILFVYKNTFLTGFLDKLEVLVALMLIVLGAISLAQAGGLHAHAHKHGREKHTHSHIADEDKHLHKHMLGIGVVHGLASNDELLVLITGSLALTSLADVIAGVALFSFGVVIGMVAYSLALAYAIVKTRKEQFANAINLLAGVLSIAYGIALLVGVT